MNAMPDRSAAKFSLTTPSDRVIRVERMLNASRDRVWKAFSDPKLLAQWWGRGNPLDIETFEFARGGHWRFVEHADGDTHGFEGRYREITEPQRIVRTFEWDGMPGYVIIETATFADVGDGRTQLVIESLFHTTDERNGMLDMGMEGGLTQSLDALDRLLQDER